MMIKILFVVLASSFLAACCGTGTTVVLVPDAGGKVGKVSLTTQAGTTLLSKANESSAAAKAGQAPTTPIILSDEKVHDMFAETLAKEPTPPERFRLYFGMGSAELSQESIAEIPKINAAIQARKSCDLSVIGHSDRVGDNASNKGLSMQRAENVAKELTKLGMTTKCMDLRYYGENDPAVPTEDNVAEALNRRVEVEIR
jgi:outer membrane protein OmpA-like peptidoglycan-associated protein